MVAILYVQCTQIYIHFTFYDPENIRLYYAKFDSQSAANLETVLLYKSDNESGALSSYNIPLDPLNTLDDKNWSWT